MISSLAGLAQALDPDRVQGQELARDELSSSAYTRATPNFLSRAVEWIFEQLSQIPSPQVGLASPYFGLVLLILVLAAVGLVIWLRAGRLRAPRAAAKPRNMFGEVIRSAAEHRALADSAARKRDWLVAVCERFRAVIRSLEERAIIDERPGRTALEAATEAGQLLPYLSTDLLTGATVFDEVLYGDRPATSAHNELLQALDKAVSKARPAHEPAPVLAGLVAPQ